MNTFQVNSQVNQGITVPCLLNNPQIKQISQVDILDKKYENHPIEDVKAPQIHKIVIILHTKDVNNEDRLLLNKFGRVRDLNYSMYNLDLNKLDCDYLLVDCRDKLNKLHITRVKCDDYNWCAYVHCFEKHDSIFDDFKDDINVMTKFPHEYKVAYKCEFDDVLTSCKKIKNSSCFLSLVSFLVNGFQTVLKKQ